MGDVIPFPRRGFAIDASRHSENAPKPWGLILIHRDGQGGYVVDAWTHRPDFPGAERLRLGFAPTLVEAAELARSKGAELGVREIHDFSHVPDADEPGPGDAA